MNTPAMANLNTMSRLIPDENVTCRQTNTGAILVNIETGRCFELNHVGADVWTALAAGETIGGMIDAVRTKYNVAHDIVAVDVNRICSQLLGACLVVVLQKESR